VCAKILLGITVAKYEENAKGLVVTTSILPKAITCGLPVELKASKMRRKSRNMMIPQRIGGDCLQS